PEPDQTTEYIDVSDIDDVEEQEVNFGPISLQAVKSDPSPAHRPAAQVHKLSPVVHEIEEMDEVEVEFPELFQEPERAMGVVTPLVSVDAEGAELTFTRFEAPFLAPDGRAVIPALFIDGAGNSVRIRIHIAVDKERS
ncbi:MAG: hypothetical protein FWH25_04550, partial [Syntrophorhabdaceae bacterium]|nr:hypothetical protein [Syntrophorhabdaceae bacterium]